MAYASTLTIYIYDVRDFSLVTILGGNGSSVQSVLWHTQNPHRLILFRCVDPTSSHATLTIRSDHISLACCRHHPVTENRSLLLAG